MKITERIANACNISIEDAERELECERVNVQSMLTEGCLDYEALDQICMGLGIEMDDEAMFSLLLI